MPKFTVNHNTNLKPTEAYIKAKAILEKGDELKKYDPSLKCHFDDAGKSCEIKGRMFSAQLKVSETDQGSKVSIDVDLPLLLAAFKSKVQDSLSRLMSKHLV